MGVWGSFLFAAAALKTPTQNCYNAQGVNLTFTEMRIPASPRRPGLQKPARLWLTLILTLMHTYRSVRFADMVVSRC